jgi:predicted PurR-regulated permease PerM
MDNRSSPNMILWFFLGLFLVSCFLLGKLFWPFLSVIVVAAVVTGVFQPVFLYLSRKMNPSLASLATCAIIFILLFLPIVFFVGILSTEAYDLYLMGKGAVLSNNVQEFLKESTILDRMNLVLAKYGLEFSGEQLQSGVSQIGKTVGFFLYNQASSIASNVLNFLIYFFFMLLITYYLLVDGKRLISFIFDLSPLPREQDDKLLQRFKDIASAILIGNGLGGLIQGLLGGIVFSVFGFTSPFLWGVIMALLAFLPIVGIGVVFIPAGIYLFIVGRLGAGIFFVVFYVILSGCIEYIFKPKLVGKRVKMHTLLVVLSIMGGLRLFGILGIIYGPLVVTAFLTLTDIYRASYQRLVDPVEE